MAKFCKECGAELGAGAKFCPECGTGITGTEATAQTTPPDATQPTPVAPVPMPAGEGTVSSDTSTGGRNRPPPWIFALAGAAAVGLVVAIALLAAGGNGGDESSSRKQVAKSTTTTIDPKTAKKLQELARLEEQLRQVAQRIDGILSQSAAGRGDVASTVARVQECAIYPYEGADSMVTVIENRESVLAGIRALPASEFSQAVELVTLLQNGIQESLQSDYYYRDWMNDLSRYYYDTCDYRGAYSTENLVKANEASGRATAAKNAFVNAYNPVAARFGLRQWGAGDI